jgi:hypothetical protein
MGFAEHGWELLDIGGRKENFAREVIFATNH